MSAVVEKKLYIGSFRHEFGIGNHVELFTSDGKSAAGTIIEIDDTFITLLKEDRLITIAVSDIEDYGPVAQDHYGPEF